jgi:hypothetical protein|tara:strand:+ start:1512 stop:2420 length:909 start_codon:yes stop_codon:yes gene_type:complete
MLIRHLFIRSLSLFLVVGCHYAYAQNTPDEVLEFDRPEAWAMRYFAGAALMQGNAAPIGLEKGQLSLGTEISNLPYISKENRAVGFYGTKDENLNKSPIILRPMVHYGILKDLSVTATYVPPIEVFDRLRTHMAGVSINYIAYQNENFIVRLRAYGQWTQAKGDFTASEDIAGSTDPNINPFGLAEPSNDTFTSWTYTFEASFFLRLPIKNPTYWSLSLARSYADLDFEIDAVYFGGFHENRHQVTDGYITSVSTGFETQLTKNLSTSLIMAYVPLDVRRSQGAEQQNDALLNFRLAFNLKL